MEYALYTYTEQGNLEFYALYETKKELFVDIDRLQAQNLETYWEIEE